ncbi:MAG: ATP-binding protein [Candidatus Altiarchaeota archaeon]
MKKKDSKKPLPLKKIKTTEDIKIPEDIIEQVIGQPQAVKKVKLAMAQRRHLLLVGPPGVGKSMLAQALATHLPKPTQQINIVHNPANPNRPLVEVVSDEPHEKLIEPREVPSFVAEHLGYKCARCGAYSTPGKKECPTCGKDKFEHITVKDRVKTTCFGVKGQETDVVYERAGEKVKTIDHVVERADFKRETLRMTLVPLDRKTFVHATGASETELLGDVRHDPYGSHPDIGTPAYLRVVAGSIHEAHEGVLFIDELPHLGHLQNFILTAMQEKKFSLLGRNPQSSGAAVKVEDVPCDFLFVGACNIKDVQEILSPLRSRILGNGYEILLETYMPDTEENRAYMAQFIAQEIVKDAKIPPASRASIDLVIEEAGKRARVMDDAKNALTLRLRDLGGVVRLAGDFAKLEKSKLIEPKHIKEAINEAKPIEYQLEERYGSVWKGIEKDRIISPDYGKTGSSYV